MTWGIEWDTACGMEWDTALGMEWDTALDEVGSAAWRRIWDMAQGGVTTLELAPLAQWTTR